MQPAIDAEVESTLREIREHVRAEEEARALQRTADSVVPAGSDARLAQLEANLTTTDRAWNRLPPLISYRHGWTAQLELWIKRQVKRLTHWYTWEQINFNAAVHSSLRDVSVLLSHQQQTLLLMHDQVTVLLQAKAETEARFAAFEARLTSAETHFAAMLSAEVNGLRDQQQAQTAEQRVCFKQLALENSETTITFDRARRDMQLRLSEMRKELNQLQQATEANAAELAQIELRASANTTTTAAAGNTGHTARSA